MATRADSTPAPSRRRRRSAKVAQLAPPDRARIEGLIARLIDLLDTYDAPSADMEPEWDHEADADAERSLQPLPLEPQPFPGRTQEARGQCAPVVSRHDDAKPHLAEGKVVSHRRGSKPRRMMIEGELVR